MLLFMLAQRRTFLNFIFSIVKLILTFIGKFFGIICAAGGERSYLSTQHLTQICMNEWRMIQLPRIIYATGKDFEENKVNNKDLLERLDVFSEEFNTIGKKLIS